MKKIMMIAAVCFHATFLFASNDEAVHMGGKIKSPKELMMKIEEQIVIARDGKKGEDLVEYALEKKTILEANFTQGKLQTLCGGQAFALTMPMSFFFEPNSVLISQQGAHDFLDMVVNILLDKKMKLLIASHWDNQGSEAYKQEMTENRAVIISDWLEYKGVQGKYIETYPLRDVSPITDNSNMFKRAENRRITFYFIAKGGLLYTPMMQKMTRWFNK